MTLQTGDCVMPFHILRHRFATRDTAQNVSPPNKLLTLNNCAIAFSKQYEAYPY